MIRLVPWSDCARGYLERVEGLEIDDVQREVEKGISQLWECSMGVEIRGYVVTRLESRGGQREWVWLACAGRGFKHYVLFFLTSARTQNLPIRVYVRRPGMRRMYESLGFKTDATVMRLSHNVIR